MADYDKIKKHYDSCFPIVKDLKAWDLYQAPISGFYIINSHYVEMKAGDLISFNEIGEPVITPSSLFQ